jgi:hypothetical protein
MHAIKYTAQNNGRDIALAELSKLKSIGRYSKGIIKDALEKIKGGEQHGDKTLSIRMDDEEYKFLSSLAIEKYKKSEASIEKAARIAGVFISKMMDIFREHGVEAKYRI